MQSPTYTYYKEIFRSTSMPFAFVDLDLFDENVKQIKPRAKGKKIRIASKSVRNWVLLSCRLGLMFTFVSCYFIPA